MDEIKLQQIRNIRSGLLLQSDWTQGNDSPLTDSKKAEWRTYRQQLRDFPASWTPSETLELPKAPNE